MNFFDGPVQAMLPCSPRNMLSSRAACRDARYVLARNADVASDWQFRSFVSKSSTSKRCVCWSEVLVVAPSRLAVSLRYEDFEAFHDFLRCTTSTVHHVVLKAYNLQDVKALMSSVLFEGIEVLQAKFPLTDHVLLSEPNNFLTSLRVMDLSEGATNTVTPFLACRLLVDLSLCTCAQ